MGNPYFQFKTFCVWHDKCAMKVGTDGVLLGAWAQVDHATTALDVGTGSGLIALMLASRSSQIQVTAIDIDKDAVNQAADNFEKSSFASRLTVRQEDFGHATDKARATYDLIVSNPPFFTEKVLCPDTRRSMARSNTHLPFELLLENSATLLNPNGHLSVIIPFSESASFIAEAAAHGLYLYRRCDVRSTERKPPVRTLLELGRHGGDTQTDLLTIHAHGGGLSPEMKQLTEDFYL